MAHPSVSPGSPALLLFPTDLEAQRFEDQGGLPQGLALRAIAGFGPVAAAARTALLIARLRPRRCILIGIAGTFAPEEHPVGSARTFTEVAIDGIGVGEGESHRGTPSLGFPQWPGSDAPGDSPIQNRLALEPMPGVTAAGLLLTTCAASDSPSHAALRRKRFPDASAEDMEAFSAAFACRLASTPFSVIRGLSNVVGDRERDNWRIPLALAAAREALLATLEHEGRSK